MIDFHCHLDLFPNPVSVADHCEKDGIYVLSVTTTPSAWHGTKKLERSRIRTALGLHPQLAHHRRNELALFDRLLGETNYVGEIGLDGGPEFKERWDDQLHVFRHILRACGAVGGRIMSIHSRRASQYVLNELQRYPEAGVAVLHWFSGNFRDLEAAIALGCWFSIGPPMLASNRGRALIQRMPRNRVLTESDGPFAQMSKKPVMPWDIASMVDPLADVWQVDPSEIRTTLARNFSTLIEMGRNAEQDTPGGYG